MFHIERKKIGEQPTNSATRLHTLNYDYGSNAPIHRRARTFQVIAGKKMPTKLLRKNKPGPRGFTLLEVLVATMLGAMAATWYFLMELYFPPRDYATA